ncbi:MAG TPA: bacillithiol biosynthesis cysteine-adding enzyme BshC [Gemmatimonadales bacterium]|nr:bacillithiol biosynthesis cysteine-adding enzyme BshC [Gemmatimonadales bacterium]
MRFHATPLQSHVNTPTPRNGDLPAIPVDAVVAPGHDLARRLMQPGALAVTTGQQPGLFTGPLYTIHKALSAAALARQLEARWRRPVVPVFWLAGDDHDFHEANHASWLRVDGTLRTHVLRERPADAPLTPMSRELLGPEIGAALDALAEDLPPSAHRDETLAWLARHYRAERPVAAAFGGALAEVLAPFGILCVDSAHPAVKRAAAPVITRALSEAGGLERLLLGQAARLAAEGVDPGVPVGGGATLVMLEGRLGRDRLISDGDAFTTRRSGERFTQAELQRLADESPERFSGNVLLRPVVESALLPTVAYIAGPGELRYLALCAPLYGALGVPRQLPVPRWSGMLIEPRVDRVLDKFGVEIAELLEPGGRLETRLARDQLPLEASAALADLRAAIERGYTTLEAMARDVDPTLQRPIQVLRHGALTGTQDAEKKLIQHLKRRQETELGQVDRARTALLPGGKPQERVLTAAPFLARYGPDLLPALAAEIHSWYGAALERGDRLA